MTAQSKLARLLLFSPWFLLVFLIVPICVVASFTLELRIPFAGPKLLLINNLLFALLVASRFVSYCAGLRKPLRYAADAGLPEHEEPLPLPLNAARSALAQAGFRCDPAGEYWEKRDRGYLGSVLFYGGLCLLLLFGTLGILRQFSGTLWDGIGSSTKLSNLESYRSLSKGPLVRDYQTLPQILIVRQVMPGDLFPKGGTELLLRSHDGKEQEVMLQPGIPLRHGAYDIYMSKLVFEPQVVIRTDKNQTVISKFVQLHPLVTRKDGFSFYATFVESNLSGDVYYQPETSRLKVVLRRDGKRVMNAELVFQGEPLVGQADLVLSCEKMGQWTEIRVVRRRPMALLAASGVLALLGLLLRLAVSPQRVWLRAQDGGGSYRAVGRDAKRALEAGAGS